MPEPGRVDGNRSIAWFGTAARVECDGSLDLAQSGPFVADFRSSVTALRQLRINRSTTPALLIGNTFCTQQ